MKSGKKHSHSPNQLLSRRSHPAAINARVYTRTSCCAINSLYFSVLPSLLFSTVKLAMQHTLVRWTKLTRCNLASAQTCCQSFIRTQLTVPDHPSGINNLGKMLTANWCVYTLCQSLAGSDIGITLSTDAWVLILVSCTWKNAHTSIQYRVIWQKPSARCRAHKQTTRHNSNLAIVHD